MFIYLLKMTKRIQNAFQIGHVTISVIKLPIDHDSPQLNRVGGENFQIIHHIEI